MLGILMVLAVLVGVQQARTLEGPELVDRVVHVLRVEQADVVQHPEVVYRQTCHALKQATVQ